MSVTSENEVSTTSLWSSLDTSDNSSWTEALVTVNILFLAFVLIVVSLRAFTKLFLATRLFIDDYLTLAATLFYTLFTSLNLYASTIGFGRHIWLLLPASSTTTEFTAAAAAVQQINYIALILLSPAIILGKLSVVAILLRVFPPTMRKLRYLLWALAAVIVACCTAQALMILSQCSPVQSSWRISSGSCYVAPLDVVIMGMGALNTVTDLAICAAPIPYFMRLGIPTPQKLCLCVLFMSGIIACAVSIVRWLSLLGLSQDIDITYATAPYSLWSSVEVGLIIITASVPSLRPLLATILPDFFREHNFSAMFNSERRKSGMLPADRRAGSGSAFSKDEEYAAKTSTSGTITITKEYEICNGDLEPPRAPSTSRPCTPLTEKLGPRVISTCVRVTSDSS